MAALNSRFRPRLGAFRLRGFSLTLGTSPALKIALRLRLESKPPSRLRYAPPISKSVSLATRFKAFNPSGRSTVSASFTGATGSGANTKPLFSTIARTGTVKLSGVRLCGSGGGRVSVPDDDIPRPALCRLSLSGRTHQLRGVALFPLPAEPAYGRGDAGGARHLGDLRDDPAMEPEIRPRI